MNDPKSILHKFVDVQFVKSANCSKCDSEICVNVVEKVFAESKRKKYNLNEKRVIEIENIENCEINLKLCFSRTNFYHKNHNYGFNRQISQEK